MTFKSDIQGFSDALKTSIPTKIDTECQDLWSFLKIDLLLISPYLCSMPEDLITHDFKVIEPLFCLNRLSDNQGKFYSHFCVLDIWEHYYKEFSGRETNFWKIACWNLENYGKGIALFDFFARKISILNFEVKAQNWNYNDYRKQKKGAKNDKVSSELVGWWKFIILPVPVCK